MTNQLKKYIKKTLKLLVIVLCSCNHKDNNKSLSNRTDTFYKSIDILFNNAKVNRSDTNIYNYRFDFDNRARNLKSILNSGDTSFPFLFKFPWYEVEDSTKLKIYNLMSNIENKNTSIFGYEKKIYSANKQIICYWKIEKWASIQSGNLKKIESILENAVPFKVNSYYTLFRKSFYEMQIKIGEDDIIFIENFKADNFHGPSLKTDDILSVIN